MLVDQGEIRRNSSQPCKIYGKVGLIVVPGHDVASLLLATTSAFRAFWLCGCFGFSFALLFALFFALALALGAFAVLALVLAGFA